MLLIECQTVREFAPDFAVAISGRVVIDYGRAPLAVAAAEAARLQGPPPVGFRRVSLSFTETKYTNRLRVEWRDVEMLPPGFPCQMADAPAA